MRRSVLACLAFVLCAGHVAADTNLEKFLDGVMETYLVEGRTVGGVVAVVQDDRLLLARGYGYADEVLGIRVEARNTLFRVGSVTKVLTWMGVLQQVEAGRFSLDEDINEYLERTRVPRSLPAPVTLRHLMTHTAGYEDRWIGLFASGPRTLPPLIEAMDALQPKRLWMPGSVLAYSNYGTALAAVALEDVTGVKWEAYLDDHVLGPLGMSSTSALQPLPDAFKERASVGYSVTGGMAEPRGFEFFALPPAGSVSSTAVDMARLMAELLDPRGTSVLSSASKERLLEGAYLPHPGVNGMTLGMMEHTMGGERAVGHSGATMLFHARMVLWPEQNLGLFVAFNTDVAGTAANRFIETFASYYGLIRRHEGGAPVLDGEAYEGYYLPNRRVHSTVAKVAALREGVLIDYDLDGQQLWLRTPNERVRFAAIDEDLFGEVGGHRRIAFQDDALYLSSVPHTGFERASRFERWGVNAMWLGISWAVLGSALILWPVSMVFGGRGAGVEGQWRASLVAYVVIVLLLGLFIGAVTNVVDTVVFVTGGYRQIDVWLWLGVVAAGLLLYQYYHTYRSWAVGYWWLARRVHYSVVTVAATLVVLWLYYWNALPAWLLGLFG